MGFIERGDNVPVLTVILQIVGSERAASGASARVLEAEHSTRSWRRSQRGRGNGVAADM
jgi:uncharacterized alpha-E superfamily protein